ncbi:glutaredoxin 3 [Kaarinaea lacus]
MKNLPVKYTHSLVLSKCVDVEMYCNASCPFCELARSLLRKKGVAFIEHRIDKEDSVRDEMIQRSNSKTVPQIFIGNYHIGGYDDLHKLNEINVLDNLLYMPRK